MSALTFDQVVEQLRSDVEQTARQSVGGDLLLMDAGILDSMAMVLFVAHVEETYDLTIPAEDLSANVLASINAAAHYVVRRLAAR